MNVFQRKLNIELDELSPDFRATTVPEMTGVPDEKLLPKAEKKFDVFLTSDRNLSFQQPVENISIHVVLLKASSNIYEDLCCLL